MQILQLLLCSSLTAINRNMVWNMEYGGICTRVFLSTNIAMGLAAYALLTIGFLPCFINADFSVYWNFFSKTCQKKLDPLLEKYSFTQNAGHEFRGNTIALFYEFNHGRYPYYKDYDINKPIYGGTPQNLSADNLAEHLKVSEENITTYINDTQSSGLGILDFEEWRPLFDINSVRKEVYKKAAIEISKKNHTDITDPKKLNETAAMEYDEAARKFIEGSLQDAWKIRSKTRWGLYGFPYCNYDAGKWKNESRCSKKYQNFNDRMEYIFNASQALYPSIYLNNHTDPERNFRYVQAIVAETQRVAYNYTRKLPIYVYTKIEYDPKKNFTFFYTAKDLCSTILLPYIMGVDGLIFWSTSNNMTVRCDPITNFLSSTLGPFIQGVVSGSYGQKAKYNATKVWEFDEVCNQTITDIIEKYMETSTISNTLTSN